MLYGKIVKELRAIAKDVVSGESADQAYKRNVKGVVKLLVDIKKELSGWDKDQEKEPNNWGFAGSMGHAYEELEEIYSFLKRR